MVLCLLILLMVAVQGANSASSATSSVTHAIVFFPAASDPLGRQGFARIVSRSDSEGIVSIVAFDDSGRRYGPTELMLAPHQTAHFNSDDLEDGAPEKGLSEGVGRPSEGDWRLALTSELDTNVLSYIRTDDGFVTSMHDVAPSAGSTQRVAFFNPGSNHAQQSLLRLVNPGTAAAATVTIHGLDDRGDAPGSAVRLSIPPGGARTLSAADLESGMVDVDGALGDGVGKWRLDVESDRPVLVLSLLATPTGHLTNLSDPTHDVDLTWVFAGDVSDDHKDLFRQEMKNVRSFLRPHAGRPGNFLHRPGWGKLRCTRYCVQRCSGRTAGGQSLSIAHTIDAGEHVWRRSGRDNFDPRCCSDSALRVGGSVRFRQVGVRQERHRP